jgi:hypothetical protein
MAGWPSGGGWRKRRCPETRKPLRFGGAFFVKASLWSLKDVAAQIGGFGQLAQMLLDEFRIDDHLVT